MKNWMTISGLLLLAGISHAQRVIQPPLSKHNTAFAIIIDQETLAHTRTAVHAYRDMLEAKEGLSVYIVSDNWQRPEDIKAVLQQLTAKQPVLEGAVFIGNIPIAMVRNAQHLTTALKIDERKYTLQRTAVPTDRFYDDFDLSFRFVKQDETNSALFYYELVETGPQIIHSDLYTSRILSHRAGDGKYDDINHYLQKAVAARQSPDPLDKLLSFTGAGYNSESLGAWIDEKPALQELFPLAFAQPGNNHYLNFRMEPSMKARLFSELQRPGLDLAILTTHGENDLQHLNPLPPGDDWDGAYRNLRFLVRSDLRKAVKRGRSAEAVKQQYATRYGISESWFDGALDNDSLRVADSLFYAATDIVIPDVERLSQQAKVIMLNACGTAAFQQTDNIANTYLFNKGNTLVVQGNTINVLQDKWVLQQMGMLQHGVRVGLWSYKVNTLESQLLGDPTWHFSDAGATALNTQLVLQKNKKETWQSLLQSKSPALQSAALQLLFEQQGTAMAPLLAKTYTTSPSANVRMQCLALLAQTGGEAYRQTLLSALNDNYELIRRKAADWLAKDGSPQFIQPLVTLGLQGPDDERVLYNVYKALALMDWELVTTAVNEQLSAISYLYNIPSFRENWLKKIAKDKAAAYAALDKIRDNNEKEDTRIQAIRSLRNGNYHKLVPDFVQIATDKQTPPLIRKHLLEALGWFSTSYQKDKIQAACASIIKDTADDISVKEEAEQTQRRLQQWVLY
jgi:hypothetical protein